MDGVGLFGSQFPPGFRFHPTDQELIIHYMRSKITSTNTMVTSIIADVDIYKFNPWDLPDKAFFGEGEWFFFSPRDRKYPNGARPNRAAASGYWKATGTDKPILAIGGSQCLGVKKALVFYQGRPPKGNKTDWVMHEYRLLDAPNPPTSNFSKHKAANSMRLDDWVLCRVRKKVSTPTQSEEEGGGGVLAESSSGLTYPPINPNLIIDQRRQQQQQITPKELSSGNNNIYMSNYEEHQPAAFTADTIIDYQEDQKGGESCTSYNSNLDFTKSSDVSNMSFVIDQMQQQQQQLVSPMLLGSLKRTFSFGGALDELMFQTPNKRLAYSVDHDDEQQLSRGLSVYIDQSFPDFF